MSAVLCVLFAAFFSPAPAQAIEAIAVGADQERIDITAHTERFSGRGDHLQLETAPGPDGLAGRVEVRAQTPGTSPSWMVFALHNTTDKSIERWLVAERFTFIGSGLSYPDLDASRIIAVTPSQGFVPDRVTSDRADIFQVSIDPGQTVTFAAEMASERFPHVMLWKPFVYEAKQRERTLLNGILLGITGLLAVFLTALFAANHKAVFPATGVVAWSILALLCVDFDFWHRIFRITAEDNALYRAAAEAAVAASLVLFLYTFLKIGRWHGWIRAFWLAWLLAQAALVALAPLDPGLAVTLARYSYMVIGGLGSLFILYLVLANQDRALALLPSWLLLLVWVFAAALAVTGRLTGEFIAAGLVSGLVFILLMLGFTVTQFAFRSADAAQIGGGESSQLRNFAIEGAGLATFEWNSRRNEVQTGPLIEDILGLQRGRLTCGLDDWLRQVGSRDRERLREMFKDIAEKGGGALQTDFTMQGSDNAQHWFSLRGASLPQSDARVVRCVGLLRETTRERHAQERIMVDAIRDYRTGLPNRELFLDRLAYSVRQARLSRSGARLGLILFELTSLGTLLEEFDETAVEGGLRSMLKRLQNALQPLDTVGRMSSERYAILVPDTGDTTHLAKLIEQIRQAIRNPVPIGRSEQVLSANVGVALLSEEHADAQNVLADAEAALDRAKRAGPDRFEVFRPSMRMESDPRIADAALLRKAIERKQIGFLYQPIYGLAPERLAGFAALPQWQHPERGALGLNAFMPVAAEAGFAEALGLQLAEAAVRTAMAWQKALPRDEEPLFISLALGPGLPLRMEIVQEIRKILTRVPLPRGLLRLEIADAAVRENPELAGDILERLKAAGAGASLSDFGSAQFPIAYLPRLAIDVVKLDRWICLDALASDSGIALLRGVAALARELSLGVYTDALESPGDVAILRGAGCGLGSGPLYGEPLDERQVTDLLATVRNAERKSERRGSLTGGLLSKAARTATVMVAEPLKETRRAIASSVGQTVPKRTADAGKSLARAPKPVEAPAASATPDTTEAARFDEALSANALAGAYDAARAHAGFEGQAAAQPDWAPPSRLQAAARSGAMPDDSISAPATASAQSPASPANVAVRTENPTIAMRTRRNEGAPVLPSSAPPSYALNPSADVQVGLARLQRGQFGTKSAATMANAAPVPPAEPLSTPAAPAATASRPGSPPLDVPDTLPDADILRGLAARLEAALKRDGH